MNDSTSMSVGSECHPHATVRRAVQIARVAHDILQSHGIAQSSASVVYCSAMCCAAFEQDNSMVLCSVVCQILHSVTYFQSIVS